MPKTPEFDHGQPLPKLQGHAIGVVDSDAACRQLSEELGIEGFGSSRLLIFHGQDGIDLVNRMMEGQTWGESSEHFLMQCLNELHEGHSIVSVEVDNEREASTVAAIASQYGAHSVYHFGLLTDTQLTP